MKDHQTRIIMLQYRIEQAEAAILRCRKRELRALEDLQDALQGIKDNEHELQAMNDGIRELIKQGYTL